MTRTRPVSNLPWRCGRPNHQVLMIEHGHCRFCDALDADDPVRRPPDREFSAEARAEARHDAVTHRRNDDPDTAHEAAEHAAPMMGRRRNEVWLLFAENRDRWIARWEFTSPTCGGTQGDRRLRDLAAEVATFDYEAKLFDGVWWYRATRVDGFPTRTPPDPDKSRACCPTCGRP